MKLERYAPSDILKPFVRAFLIIESEDGTNNKVLPDTSLVMAFRLKGTTIYSENGSQHNIPASVVTGIRKSSRIISYSKDSATLLVQFNELGAATFLKEPLHELFDQSISLDHFLSKQKIDETEYRLAEAETNLKRISVIEQFLCSELKETRSTLLIGNAVQRIKLAKGNIRIRDLVTSLNISEDPFEKQFRRVVGTSPKQFASIIRFKNLIQNFLPGQNLTAVAYDAGYFDQAHFIKDFRSFTGQTPHNFFKTSSYW